jgi:hypothetical protein
MRRVVMEPLCEWFVVEARSHGGAALYLLNACGARSRAYRSRKKSATSAISLVTR